jgi:hypothetical protein
MRIVIRSSSLLFSVLGIIFQAPVTKVKKKKSESDERENARPESGNGPEQSERVQ